MGVRFFTAVNDISRSFEGSKVPFPRTFWKLVVAELVKSSHSRSSMINSCKSWRLSTCVLVSFKICFVCCLKIPDFDKSSSSTAETRLSFFGGDNCSFSAIRSAVEVKAKGLRSSRPGISYHNPTLSIQDLVRGGARVDETRLQREAYRHRSKASAHRQGSSHHHTSPRVATVRPK